jgi:branched-chain amino acid transport system permease protein
MDSLFYQQRGTGNEKMVFIHGNTGSWRWWQPVMELMEQECVMAAPDLRGFGRSPAGSDNVTLADHAADVKALAASLGFGRLVLVGHSLGGGVAMQFAALYPELLRGLVLVDSSPLGGLKGVNYAFLEMALKNNLMVAGLKGTMAQPPAEEFFAGLAEDCLRSLASVIPNTRALEAADFREAAPRFTAPVLVVHGEKDPLVPLAESEKIAAAYRSASLTVIAAAGHAPQVEKPAVFVDGLRRFLTTL